MKAAYLTNYGGIDSIEFGELPIPEPKEGEVQIEVVYAGVNPVDWKIADGHVKSLFTCEFPVVLGWDIAGRVSKLGDKVSQFKVGDEVFCYGRKATVHDGGFANYFCLDANYVCLKPKSLSFEKAAVVPLSALTAWQSLFDAAHLRAKEHILIHAGAGGVGGYAIQFAKNVGAHVITTAQRKNHEYVKQFGPDEVVDYTEESFADRVHKMLPEGVDVVYDTVGGETLKTSYEVTKVGGRLITITSGIDAPLAKQRLLEAQFVLVQQNGRELLDIAQLFDSGKLIPPKVEVFEFKDLKAALHKNKERHTPGKIAIRIAH